MRIAIWNSPSCCVKKAEKGEKVILVLVKDTAFSLIQHKFNKAGFPVSLLAVQTQLFHEGLDRELGLGLYENWKSFIFRLV